VETSRFPDTEDTGGFGASLRHRDDTAVIPDDHIQWIQKEIVMSSFRYRLPLLVALMALLALGASAVLPSVGQPAPEFTLVDGDGNEVSLEDQRGKWVVLYFYPKNFTSGCTIEAQEFQRDLAKYEAAGAVVLGVSVDSPESHKSFCEKEGLDLTLLSDQDAAVSARYGSVIEYEGQTLSARNTFLIDPAGRLVRIFEKVKPVGHSGEVLAALAELHE
jgi:thioredoxin-dependent peroxiredoxin